MDVKIVGYVPKEEGNNEPSPPFAAAWRFWQSRNIQCNQSGGTKRYPNVRMVFNVIRKVVINGTGVGLL